MPNKSRHGKRRHSTPSKRRKERQLAQRFLTQNQEAQIRNLTEKIGIGLRKLGLHW